jgi:hypothetical protein
VTKRNPFSKSGSNLESPTAISLNL